MINTGYVDEATTTLDKLYVFGYLKGLGEPQSIAARRKDNGQALQDLYMSFMARGREASDATEYRVMLTQEGHIGTERDISETKYSEIMRRLGAKRSELIQRVCIDDLMRADANLEGVMEQTPIAQYLLENALKRIRMALDELPRVMEQVEKEILKRIEDKEKKNEHKKD